MQTRDLYGHLNFVYSAIDVSNTSTEDIKKLYDVAVLGYTLIKIKKLDPKFVYDKNMTTKNLVHILSEKIGNENQELLAPFIHSTLNILSQMQGYHVCWLEERGSILEGNVKLTFLGDGKLDYVIKKDKTSLVETFDVVYDYFMDEFMEKRTKKLNKTGNYIN